MERLTLARALAACAAGYALLVIVIGGAIKPDYSHVGNFISELGASGTAYGAQLSMAGFLPVGILIAAFLITAAPLVRVSGASRAGYWLLLSQAVAYIGSAFAPCDAGCPAEGSPAQMMHNLLAIVTYMTAGVGLALLASARSVTRTARAGLVIAAVAWFIGFFLMLAPELAHVRGLPQRVVESTLWLVLLFVAFRMTGEQRQSRPA